MAAPSLDDLQARQLGTALLKGTQPLATAREAGHDRVLGISEAALDVARRRIGPRAVLPRWIAGDVRYAALPPAAFDVWRDRAPFHFMVDPDDRCLWPASRACHSAGWARDRGDLRSGRPGQVQRLARATVRTLPTAQGSALPTSWWSIWMKPTGRLRARCSIFFTATACCSNARSASCPPRPLLADSCLQGAAISPAFTKVGAHFMTLAPAPMFGAPARQSPPWPGCIGSIRSTDQPLDPNRAPQVVLRTKRAVQRSSRCLLKRRR